MTTRTPPITPCTTLEEANERNAWLERMIARTWSGLMSAENIPERLAAVRQDLDTAMRERGLLPSPVEFTNEKPIGRDEYPAITI